MSESEAVELVLAIYGMLIAVIGACLIVAWQECRKTPRPSLRRPPAPPRPFSDAVMPDKPWPRSSEGYQPIGDDSAPVPPRDD